MESIGLWLAALTLQIGAVEAVCKPDREIKN